MYYHSVSFSPVKMRIKGFPFTVVFLSLFVAWAAAQTPESKDKQSVRTVTIPISIFTKNELRQDQMEEFIQVDRLMVREDRDDQSILSVRSVTNTPLSLAILIQEDLSQEINLQLKDLRLFI